MMGTGNEERPCRRRSAWRVHALARGLAVAFLVTPTSGEGKDSIRIEARLSAGPYYVGQEVEFTLKVEAGGERPNVVPYQIAGADVAAVGADDPGREVHRFAFRIIPRRTGTLIIPAVSVRQGMRSGSSRPVQFSVRPLPLGGRPKGFLGGVGAFQVEAEASPRAVRAGGEFEYHLRIIGPAARGSREALDLTPFDRVPLGLRVTRLPDEVSTALPARVYRYRIRATRPGSAVLPPITVASFDPKTAHYLTRASPGVPVRVAAPPSLDPATVDEAPLPDSSPRGQPTLRRVAGWASGIVAALIALAGLVLSVKRRRARGHAGRFAARLARRLDASEGAAETSRRVTEGLATFLNLTAGRPPGVLTPAEAAVSVEGLTGRLDLAEDARRLVALCDRTRYSDDGAGAHGLVDGAKRLFRGLQREERRAGGRGGSAEERGSMNRREAAGTADDGVGRSKTASPSGLGEVQRSP